jgi:arginine deiminase
MVHVTSEIGRLRKVLLHGPGCEVDRMVPAMMEDLLFDDILYGDRAREEHAVFRRVLQLLGIELVEASDLLREALGRPEARAWLFDVLLEDIPRSLRELLESQSDDELAESMVCGIRQEPDHRGVEVDDLYRLAPLPNYCFQRDPQIILGDGVIFSSMAAPARHREPLLSRLIFRFHPGYADTPVILDPIRLSREHPLFVGARHPHIEGGDLLVLSPDVVAVGCSERTNHTAIQQLARTLARQDGGPRWLLEVRLPRRRAYMHLDTLITQVDGDAALVYPPVILDQGRERAEVAEYDLHAEDPVPESRDDLLGSLAARGIGLSPIRCGGSDPVHQQREQWTDGSNALALAPGVLALYDRNVRTAEELDRHGYRIVSATDLLLGREELSLDHPGRTCILLSSHEISRARGGPHCLSHPLVRDDVNPG